MKRPVLLTHEFVKSIPEKLAERTLYVSVEYATVAHKCCCGCGNEVITPLGPTDWKMIYDGESISLYPSVGNWSFPCRSHYWVEGGQAKWALPMTKAEIDAGRAYDRHLKDKHYGVGQTAGAKGQPAGPEPSADRGFWSWLSRLLDS